MADNQGKVEFVGEGSNLEATIKQIGQQFQGLENTVKARTAGISSAFDSIQKHWLAFTAALAGGEVIRRIVEQTSDMTERAINLGNALGFGASEAAVYKAAFDDINVSADEFNGAAQKLAKNVADNEPALQKMGLATRDAAGNLRPLNDLTVEAIELVNSYKAGTDRTIAGQVAFGKGFEMTSNLAKLNKQAIDDNREAMRALGAVVGEEAVANYEAYDNATDQTHRVMTALQMTVGEALMPVLTDLANWFNAIGPAAVVVIKGALGGLVASFHLVTTGVTVLWETLNAMVVTVAEPIRALSVAIARAATGDFKGAGEELKSIGHNVSSAWGQAFDEMATKAQSTRDRLTALFGNATETQPTNTNGGRSASGLVHGSQEQDKKAQTEREASLMQYFERALSMEKQYQLAKDPLREYTKQQELAFWDQLLTSDSLNTKDRIAIEQKAAALRVEIAKQTADQLKQIDDVQRDLVQTRALAAIDAERIQAQARRDTGQLTAMQLLQIDADLEAKRYQVQMQALQERLQLMQQDPNLNPVEYARLKAEIEKLDIDYANKRVQSNANKDKQSHEDNQLTKMFGNLGQDANQSLGTALNSMLSRTSTWSQAMGTLFKSTGQSLIQNLITKPLVAHAAGIAQWIGQQLGLVQAEQVGNQMVASSKVTEATTVVGANAAEAATGAAKSQAGIPYVGPILAAAAFASILALTMGAMSNIKSAAGGFDIPSGLNPVTQLHEEEMVLPAHISNPLREMLAGGQVGGGDGGATRITIHALDGASVKRVLMSNPAAVAAAVKEHVRNGSLKA